MLNGIRTRGKSVSYGPDEHLAIIDVLLLVASRQNYCASFPFIDVVTIVR